MFLQAHWFWSWTALQNYIDLFPKVICLDNSLEPATTVHAPLQQNKHMFSHYTITELTPQGNTLPPGTEAVQPPSLAKASRPYGPLSGQLMLRLESYHGFDMDSVCNTEQIL